MLHWKGSRWGLAFMLWFLGVKNWKQVRRAVPQVYLGHAERGRGVLEEQNWSDWKLGVSIPEQMEKRCPSSGVLDGAL